jgi:hypothetical protein
VICKSVLLTLLLLKGGDFSSLKSYLSFGEIIVVGKEKRKGVRPVCGD